MTIRHFQIFKAVCESGGGYGRRRAAEYYAADRQHRHQGAGGVL